MTREELHEQVRSQPMRTLAKTLGISDVALAKRCGSADVTVPPGGWWARKGVGCFGHLGIPLICALWGGRNAASRGARIGLSAPPAFGDDGARAGHAGIFR